MSSLPLPCVPQDGASQKTGISTGIGIGIFSHHSLMKVAVCYRSVGITTVTFLASATEVLCQLKRSHTACRTYLPGLLQRNKLEGDQFSRTTA